MRNLKQNKKYVLALNRAWLPVDIISARDCFRLLSKSHAKALETIEGTYVTYTLESWFDLKTHEEYNHMNTVSMEVPVPEIIILTDYDKIPDRFVKFSKGNLLIRDDYECVYCGCTLDLESATIDHIHPQSKGGNTSWENCAIACKQCNHDKGDELPVGKYKPRKEAKEPSHFSPLYQMKKKVRGLTCPESWKKFLFH